MSIVIHYFIKLIIQYQNAFMDLIVMDRITFLDNFYQGKNDVWRYILTTLTAWGAGFLLAIIFLIFISIAIFILIDMTHASSTAPLYENPLSALIILGVNYTIAFLLFYLCIRFIHHKKIISLINTSSRVSWMKILKGAVLWLILSGITMLIDFIIDPTSIKLSFNPNTFFTLLVLCLIIFPIQASFEEIFFRGYLMQGIGSLTKIPLVPLITTTTIFSLLHFFNGTDPIIGIVMVIQTFILGITLGIIVLGENRLETAMGVHIAQNIFVTAIISSSGSVLTDLPSLLTLDSEPGIGIPFFVPLIALLVIIFWNKKSKLSRILKSQDILHLKYTKPQIKGKQCFNCNTINLNEAVYCKQCGIKMKYSKSVQNCSPNRIYCLYCNTLNPEEAVYCRYCGTKIIKPNSIKIQCFNCHTINHDEAIYCKQCGTKI